ncbi:MAG: peroxidase family protein [Polyangiales bacterium]
MRSLQRSAHGPLKSFSLLKALRPSRLSWRIAVWVLVDLLKVLHSQTLRIMLSRFYVSYISTRQVPRPRAFSLWSADAAPGQEYGPISDYTCWPALVDRTFTSRHLPPASEESEATTPTSAGGRAALALPDVDRVVQELFARKQLVQSDRSSVLFTFFAQWFTDSFLRTDKHDRRKNTSNHEIDLCQIYGLDERTGRMLRSGRGGFLAGEGNDEEGRPRYPARLCDERGCVKDALRALPYAATLDEHLGPDFRQMSDEEKAQRKLGLYATGLERGNSSIGYTAISTLFLREHNRLCSLLARENEGWNDERLFQTARNINIAILLKVLLEDYVNHILGFDLFLLDTGFAEKQRWYRQTWISLEFNLLYRWHSLVPDVVHMGGRALLPREYRFNNVVLEQHGLGAAFAALSRQRAGRVGLQNTPQFLLQAERASMLMSRAFRVRGYNAYRSLFGLTPVRSFEALTNDPDLADALRGLYRDVDNLELTVGLFAEEHWPGSPFGQLMIRMVAYDAFTHIFTNPLLSQNVFNEHTFTSAGLDAIAQTCSLDALVRRNLTKQERDSLCSTGPVASFGVVQTHP